MVKTELVDTVVQTERQTGTHTKTINLKNKKTRPLPDLQSKQFDWRRAAACILGDITEETGSKQRFPHFWCLTADDTACVVCFFFFFVKVSLSPLL